MTKKAHFILIFSRNQFLHIVFRWTRVLTPAILSLHDPSAEKCTSGFLLASYDKH